MDIATLTSLTMPPLVTALPKLVEAGKLVGGKALETLVEKTTEAGVSLAKPWIGKLLNRIEEDSTAKSFAEKVALAPQNQKYQAALEVQLEDILTADPDLAAEIAWLLEKAGAENIQVQQGERSVFVKGDNPGVIMTGDIKP